MRAVPGRRRPDRARCRVRPGTTTPSTVGVQEQPSRQKAEVTADCRVAVGVSSRHAMVLLIPPEEEEHCAASATCSVALASQGHPYAAQGCPHLPKVVVPRPLVHVAPEGRPAAFHNAPVEVRPGLGSTEQLRHRACPRALPEYRHPATQPCLLNAVQWGVLHVCGAGLSGSPPKAAMLAWSHLRACMLSKSP